MQCYRDGNSILYKQYKRSQVTFLVYKELHYPWLTTEISRNEWKIEKFKYPLELQDITLKSDKRLSKVYRSIINQSPLIIGL